MTERTISEGVGVVATVQPGYYGPTPSDRTRDTLRNVVGTEMGDLRLS